MLSILELLDLYDEFSFLRQRLLSVTFWGELQIISVIKEGWTGLSKPNF